MSENEPTVLEALTRIAEALETCAQQLVEINAAQGSCQVTLEDVSELAVIALQGCAP